MTLVLTGGVNRGRMVLMLGWLRVYSVRRRLVTRRMCRLLSNRPYTTRCRAAVGLARVSVRLITDLDCRTYDMP